MKNINYKLVFVLGGIAMIIYAIFMLLPFLYQISFNDLLSIYFLLLYLNFVILGISSVFSGLLIWKPTKTPLGKKKLGILSTAIGVLLIIILIIDIGVYATWSWLASPWAPSIAFIPQHAFFFIVGVVLIIHGRFLMKDKRTTEELSEREKEKKTLYTVVFVLSGIAMIINAIFMSLPYLYQISFNDLLSIYFLLLYLNFAILGISSVFSGLLIWKPTKTPLGKKKLGILSTAIGVLLIIITIIDIRVYVMHINATWNWSWLTSPWTLLIAFIPQHAFFFIMGVVLIRHGIFLMKDKRTAKELKKKVKQAEISYKQTFPYICDSCREFIHTLTEYCESCGSKGSLRKAMNRDYEEQRIK
ncbi:MAG: hypothetical protein ACFE92_17935 [Promethearchaeota archaeon]